MSSELPELSKKIEMPKSWQDAEMETLKHIQGVCLDIDDTLSTSGKLTGEAYSALWKLKEAGFVVVPITGRPAGWCDQIARFWPVDAVIGENGAFSFFMDKGVRRRLNTPTGSAGLSDTQLKAKLTKLGEKIRHRFPHALWASDQVYREYDLAIDICEDVKPWSSEDVNTLLALCKEEGAHAKLSSIHVNTWFGDYDKKKGFDFWLEKGAPGLNGKVPSKDQWLYIGDSPNDEPMFATFRCSVGVANLKKYLNRLNHPPTWMTAGESGRGFVQMAKKLILSRS